MKSLVTLQQTFNFQTDKFSRHFYLEVYDLFFLPYHHSPANLLEIGIEFGGSIDLWNHYFRNMNIVGMDVEKRDTMPIGDRIYYHFLDAYTPTAIELLRKQYGTFRIIIDDGPHTLESQIFAVEQYSTLINEGLFVIEDIHRDNPFHFIYIPSRIELNDYVPLKTPSCNRVFAEYCLAIQYLKCKSTIFTSA